MEKRDQIGTRMGNSNSNGVMVDDVYGTTITTIRSISSVDQSPLLSQPGQKVFALHANQYHEAQVIDVRSGSEIKQYLVRYNGWSEEWDEWLGVEYLKNYNNDNEKHPICKDLRLNSKKDTKPARSSKIEPKKINDTDNYRMLKKRLRREELKTKKLTKMLRELLNVSNITTNELHTISDNLRIEKEELEKKLEEKTSIAERVTDHFTKQFRKLLSDRRALEEAVLTMEKEWLAKEADLEKQLDEVKAEAAALKSSLNVMQINCCCQMVDCPDLGFGFRE